LAFDDAAADLFQVDTIAVVTQFEHQQTGLMRSTQADQALFGLALEQALFRGFDAVVDRVTQQMSQRRFEFFQYIAVDLRLLAFDFQPHLFAKTAPQIPNHAHLTGEHVGKRAHAAGQRGVVEHLCTLAGLPGKFVKLGVLFREQLLRLGQQAPRIFKGFLGFEAQRLFLEMHIEAFQRPQTIVLHAPEALHGSQMRLESLGFDQ